MCIAIRTDLDMEIVILQFILQATHRCGTLPRGSHEAFGFFFVWGKHEEREMRRRTKKTWRSV